jgi:hypothetical protein
MGWATFWPLDSQTHPVTLLWSPETAKLSHKLFFVHVPSGFCRHVHLKCTKDATFAKLICLVASPLKTSTIKITRPTIVRIHDRVARCVCEKIAQKVAKHIICSTRVTRLGEFSPVGRLFSYYSFLNNREAALVLGVLFSTVKILHSF